MESPGFSHAQQQDSDLARKLLDDMVKQADDPSLTQGEVYVLGAGPGDPDLLTLKALELMQQADVVLYDNLVSQEVLDRARRDATKICVGKKGGGDSTAQETINDSLLRLAKKGHRVCRLKRRRPFYLVEAVKKSKA